MYGDLLRVVVRAGPGMTPGKRDQERQDLAEGQRRLALALPLAGVQQATGLRGLTGLAEIIPIAEDHNQLVHRGSQRMQGGFVVESAQHTGASCFFNPYAYPELTLTETMP
jgi:hypothetical protein